MRWPALLLALALIVGCAGAAPAPPSPPPPPTPTTAPPVLRVVGAHAMVPLMRDLAFAYTQQHPELIIEVVGVGTPRGLQALQAGEAELGMVSRPLQPDELPATWGIHPLARDGLALIVHPSNPLKRLAPEQAAALWSGERFLWDDLGWLAGEVQLASREEGSGDRTVAMAALLPAGATLSRNAALLPTPGDMVRFVAEEPRALGYVSLAQLSGGVKPLALGEAAPTLASLAAGNYPLSRELSLVVPPQPNLALQRFLTWLTSEEAHRIITRRYVLLSPQ